MNHPTAEPTAARRLAIAVRGVVQGVGFRPFVYHAARSRGLRGWVRNEADEVRIEVEGETQSLDGFLEALRRAHPPQARIDAIELREVPCESRTSAGDVDAFQIRVGTGRAPPRPTIPADLATCAECLQEVRDPTQGRYRYPFTNCTNCGPRWSIIEQLPYDRPRTSMAGFPMCPDCRAEYEDPGDRRFHAQPIACPRCGPSLRLLDAVGREAAVGDDALRAAVEALCGGQIVALKGLGGFQLLVDATNAEAVARLRERKARPAKPFALMLASLDEVRKRCELAEEEARLLGSHQAPILLLRRRSGNKASGTTSGEGDSSTGRSGEVVEGVAPGNPYLGVMLPYTPLHHLLAAAVKRPVVCTSGNLSEEPMATGTREAVERLGPIADLILSHNRPIVRPVDDSVGRVGPQGLHLLRRARGFAPLPIRLAFPAPTILALGGHLKNTVALSLGSSPSAVEAGEARVRGDGSPRRDGHTPVVLSPHVGDLDNVLSVEVHRRAARDLLRFFETMPELLACDLHPDYASSREAESLAVEWDVPVVRVQHHHAHVAACMAEHGLEGPVLGLAWDGTGYGADGTVWGGEALVCEGAGFTRTAHLRTFPLPGGDRAVRQPRRSALGVLFEFLGEEAAGHVERWFEAWELETLLAVLGRSLHAPRTSSMGRLFDAVAALCGLAPVISFEGQAAMALEFAADEAEHQAYPLPLSEGTPVTADWEPMILAVLADRAAGVPVGRISARFHQALAELAVAVAQRCGCSQVALGGGCFQNALLTRRVHGRLVQSGFNVYLPREIPPGDGGIALGQVFVAARQSKGP